MASAPQSFAPIDLNDLPRWSTWSARLLGLETFEQPVRTQSKIDEEYGRVKWQACLDAWRTSGGKLDADQLRASYYASDPSALRPAVYHGKLLAAPASQIMAWYDDLLAEWMTAAIGRATTIVELGAGFGHILWALRRRFPGKQWRGGEYTASAVELAAGLYATHPDISVERFDFYDSRYAVLERAAAPVVVLTSQALEQIPDARGTLDTLAKYRDKIIAGFHIEPAYDLQDTSTLLGQMRRRYLEINDYNRNLFGELRRRPEIRVLRMEQDVIGWNPFNSLGMAHWEFAA
ncbi:MAG: class I SAM-dependent methyltransferase [Alphaproteobacteria bacterium]|nr:class I SAM-dependent methyltransferase [Alphaproteobacteria bacterium]